MAKTEVGLSVDIEFQSIGQMRKAIKEATGDLIAMSEKFGTSSKEATAAAKRVAELKDRLGDAKALADTFNPDKKFVALGGAIQGATAGFSALQGAMGLFGSESKDLEKMLLKVQSAMALQQGISGIAGAMDSMKMLAGTIKTQVVTAFSTLRGAIIATGFGALAVAVGVVITNFDSFKKAVFNLIPGLKGITDFIGGLVTKFTDFVGITSEAERNIEKIKKANGRANETIDAQIKLLEAQGGKEEEIYKLKKDRVENELNILRTTLKEKGKLTDEEQKQFRELNTQKVLLDAEEKARIKKANEDELKKQKEIADKKAEQRKQEAQKKAEEDERLKKEATDKLEAAEKVLDNARRAKLTDRQKEEEDVLRAFEERKKTLQLAGKTDTTAIEEQKQIELKAIQDKYNEIAKNEADKKAEKEQEIIKAKADQLLTDAENEQLSFEERILKIQERQALENQLIFESEDARKKFIAENEKAITDIKLLEAQARVNNAQFAADQLSAIAALAGQDTAAGKALSVAAATISTYLSAQKAYESQFKPVAIVDSPIRGAIAAAVAVATGIANIRKIMAVQVPSRGGGGGGASMPSVSGAAPTAPQLPPTATAQLVNAQAINNLGNQATRAYVLNSDIQNNDQRNAYLQRNARLG